MLPQVIEDGLTELHRQCVERRDIVNRLLGEKQREFRELMQKITAAERLLGEDHVRLSGGASLAEAILVTMGDNVARDAKTIRLALKGLVPERLLKMPANTLYSALHRLQNRGQLSRRGQYYRAASAAARGERRNERD